MHFRTCFSFLTQPPQEPPSTTHHLYLFHHEQENFAITYKMKTQKSHNHWICRKPIILKYTSNINPSLHNNYEPFRTIILTRLDCIQPPNWNRGLSYRSHNLHHLSRTLSLTQIAKIQFTINSQFAKMPPP